MSDRADAAKMRDAAKMCESIVFHEFSACSVIVCQGENWVLLAPKSSGSQRVPWPRHMCPGCLEDWTPETLLLIDVLLGLLQGREIAAP